MICALTVALLAASLLPLVVAGPAAAASALGLQKVASVSSTQPGADFKYTLTPRCSGLTEACENATVSDVLPAGIEVTALPQSNAERTVSYDAGTRRLTIAFIIPLNPPSPAGAVGLPAGSSRNVEIGVRVPADSAVTDGTVITNEATVTADNAATATASADVRVDVPRVVRPVATKTWTDGGAVAGSGEAGTITLGVRNSSSSTAQLSELAIQDATPAVFDRFDVTDIGPVVFPPGADRVVVAACTAALSSCTVADYTNSPAQAGPTLSLPGGVTAGEVTGLRFIFSNAAGTPIPTSPNAGSVQIGTVLRDTLRSTGGTYSPTVRDDVANCVVPSGTDPVLGEVSGPPVCATYAVQPAQATMTLDKTFFSDTNADYTADGQAVDGRNSLVSGIVKATNTSPFPVATITITDPSTSSPSEYSKVDVSNTRIVFPAGATVADVSFDCAGTTISRQFLPPPTTVDVPVPCTSGRADSVTVTFTGRDAAGNGTIAAGAAGSLGIQGRLNDTVTPEDLVGGSSAGVQNCASGTATSSDDGVGSAAAAECASVAVQPAFAQVNGVKSAQLPTILPGLPRTFTLSFINRGTVPATGVTLSDPVDPTAANNPFDSLRLQSLTLPASPAASAEVYDPDAGDYVPYVAGNAALLERAKGFRVTVTDPLPINARFSLTASVFLRDGVDTGSRIQNCAAVGSDTQPPARFCAPAITATEPSEGASVQKSLSPAESVRPQPGLPGSTVQVRLAAQNTGTLWLKRLVVTDTDPDFFDAVDLAAPAGNIRTNFPPGADRVRVDACTTGCAAGTFVEGTPTADRTPGLPGGLTAAEVRGLRFTFLTADGSFTIRPGTNFPSSGACTAASVCFDVTTRENLHSGPAVPDTLSDTANGGYETTRQQGTLALIPDTTATHVLGEGTAQLLFSKTPDSSVGPGDPIPFTLTITNTGTGPLPDPQIVDPLPDQLEFAPTDPTRPYTFEIVQPDGAPAPAGPVFTTTESPAGRVSALQWSFPGLVLLPGGSITVTFQAQLAPGVSADSTIENRAGGTADRPDLGCAAGAPRPGSETDNEAYGDGLYCTSASVVTTLAGNAFRADKWVAGDDTLGWMNSITGELLPIGDGSCPRLTVDGRDYTRYPCVARVAPGRAFDFYLRLVNAGTNPANEVRIVDVFPAPGDTGVILTDESRGTQWSSPPSLLGPVTLQGPGELNAAYTTDTPACTGDLQEPPLVPPADGACTDGDWDDDFAGSSAFRGYLTFAGGLPPGGATSLRFRMVAPAAPPNPSQNEIAWNSFAHTEFFTEPGGSITQLPPTEPIKTGVALVYGQLTIAKKVLDSDATGPYGFAYSCSVVPENLDGSDGAPVPAGEGALALAADQSLPIGPLPARARCRVWETDTAGLIGDATGEANAKVVTIPVDGTAAVPTVTVTNRPAPVTPTTPTTPSSPTTSGGPPGSATTSTTTSTPPPASTATSGPATTGNTSQPSGPGDPETDQPPGNGSASPPQALPNTGVPATRLVEWGLLLLTVGGGLIVWGRRRGRLH